MTQRLKGRRVVMPLVGALALAGLGASAVATRSPDAPGCGRFQVVSSPHISGLLNDVSGSSTKDVWAAGSYAGVMPIIEHWDGTSWTQFPQEGINGYLIGVASIAPEDAYAVGDSHVGGQWTLIEHWDGAAWSVVPSPNRGLGSYLSDVDAVSSTDVWAVGSFDKTNGSSQPLYEHWDGESWQVLPEAPGTEQSGGIMFGVEAVSSDDVWAVGYKGGEGGFDFDPLIEHWDGTAWSVIPDDPPPPGGANILHGVSATASDDVWAVGVRANGHPPLIEHWDGTAWTLVEPDMYGGLNGVWAVSSTDVWAVGTILKGNFHTLAFHWDGAQWTLVGTPTPGLGAAFAAVTAVSPTYVWAVGDYTGQTGNGFALIERTRGACP